MSDRKSPSGPISAIEGTIAVATFLAPATASSTSTAAFVPNAGPAAAAGDSLTLSPQANLAPGLVVAWARVLSSNLVVIGFANAGASTSQAAVTFDAVAHRLG